jgi:plastocyanin
MEAVAFRPPTLTLVVGDSLVWVNKDPFPHNVTAATPKGLFDSKEIGVDGSWRYTATSPGEFSYVCAYHPTMKGTLRVTDPGNTDGRRP